MTMTDRLRPYGPEDRMREMIADNHLLLMAISRFDIAFGFGDNSIANVCADNGIDLETFLAVCNLLSNRAFAPQAVNLSTLISYLKRAHDYFLDFSLPKIRHSLIDAINYSDTNDEAFLLIKFYDDYVTQVRSHMEYENSVIFRYVEKLLAGEVDERFNIADFSENHGQMATKLKDLKDAFIYHYRQRDNARLSSVLFDIIICERDFMSHFDVESRLFLPEVRHLEEVLRTRLDPGEEADDQPETDNADPQLETLGEREKDIIRCVALGMSNKEIAEELHLSIHTITTHRRNINAKLGIHSTAGLIMFAILHHIIEVNE